MRIPNGRILLLLFALCAAAGLFMAGKNVYAAQTDRGEVTYETVGDYKHIIYANGQPLLIEASDAVNYARLYVDYNGNGIGEADEEITSFKGDGLLSGDGIYYQEGYGYFLVNSSVYGGSKNGGGVYDTSVTVTGTRYVGANYYTVWDIYGGNRSGTLTGSTNINISGGNIGYVYGGSRDGVINGDTSVRINGGYVLHNTYGGNAYGRINGSTDINILNAYVYSVCGGNEDEGTVDGDTSIVFGDNAVVNGWVYGGGAGYSDDAVTEVTGTTNIMIDGGEFSHNIYGGGGWRGARTGDGNITLNGGDLRDVWIYGGGEEESSVNGRTVIRINGGRVNGVCASGAGFGSHKAEVGDVEIYLKGGSVDLFSALPNDYTAINGSLHLELWGESFNSTKLYFGRDTNPNNLKEVSVLLKDGTADLFKLQSKVEDSFDISFQNAKVTSLVLLEGTLSGTKRSSLNFKDCGSVNGRWGDYWNLGGGSDCIVGSDNPVIKGSYFYKNRFDTVNLTNSAVIFLDDSTESEDNGFAVCAKELVVDGGALRVAGDGISYMPRTSFIGSPLILRSSNYDAIYFTEMPDGTARVRWMDFDGEYTTAEWQNDFAIAYTPVGAPDDTFIPAVDGLVMKADNSLTDRRGWYYGTLEELCRCSAYSSQLRDYTLLMPEGSDGAEFILEDIRTGDTDCSSSCMVVGHKGKAADFTYSLVPDGTDAEGAAIDGNRLTVKGAGPVHVEVKQEINGKEFVYDAYLNILGAPSKNSFVFVGNMAEDISAAFTGAPFDENYLYNSVWDFSQHNYLDWGVEYENTLEDGVLVFRLNKEYLNSLETGEYLYNLGVHFERENGASALYYYEITVKIVEFIEVHEPTVKLLPERFNYDGTEKRPAVTVKYGDTVIPQSEYDVSYSDNIAAGTAKVTITNKEGGIYLIHEASAEFEIVNDYRPQNGRDYTVNPGGSGWTNGNFVITANEGFLLSGGNTLEDEWISSITRTEEAADGRVTFFVRNSETGEISLAVTENYKIDKTKPEIFDICFNGNSVRKPLQEADFGLLFKEDIEVSITADDSLSGIENVLYFRSPEILTEEQLDGVIGWTEGGEFIISAAGGERFIIYVKVTDRAGNILYFASEGAEFAAPPEEEPADYKMLEGDGSIWTKEKDGGVVFRASGSVVKFNGIKIDGNLVDAENYTIREGSTVIILKESFLKTLPVGKHIITVLYSDGEVSAQFEIRTETTDLPLGNTERRLLLGSLMLLSAAVMLKFKVALRSGGFQKRGN